MPRKDPEARRTYERERYFAAREKRLADAAEYRRTHTLEIKESQRRYRSDPANRARKLAYLKAWRAGNLPQQLRNNARYRALKLEQFLEDVDRTTVYKMHGGMCGICKQFVPEDDFHVDHVIPLSKGGMHGYVNVQPAHPTCNLRKGAHV